MKVLHILNEIRLSGAEVMIKIASPYWKESAVVLHALSTGKVKGNYADQLSNKGIIIHHIPFANSLKFHFQMIKLMHSNHFDVVHIHTEHATLTYACLARISGVSRIIRTIHSSFMFEGLTKLTRGLRRWAVRRLGVTQVSISDTVKQNEQNRFGNPTHLIYNWYDDKHFCPPTLQERAKSRKTFGLSDHQTVLVSIGNCAPVKNHEAILQALARIKKTELLALLYWHVGEEDVGKEERSFAQKLGLETQVHFWGSQDDVRPFLWAADIFVMPSFYEGFGIAVLEALGSSISLVLARSPGLEQWSAFSPAIIYTDTTAGDLARGLSQALKVPKNVKRLDQTLLKVKFAAKRGAQEYLKLYKIQGL